MVPVQCDVASQSDLAGAVEAVKARTPFINAVIANHGVTGPSLKGLPNDRVPSLEEIQEYFWKTPMAEFNDTFLVNTTAVFYIFVAFLSLLKAGNEHPDSQAAKLGIRSQLIVTSTIGAMQRRPGLGYAYSSSKSAVILLIKQLSTMFAPYQLRANVIAPGIYRTDMTTVSVPLKDTWVFLY